MAVNEEQARVLEDWGLQISSLFMVLLATVMSVMGCKSSIFLVVGNERIFI